MPKDTVRGWLRRFIARADQVREHFTRWALVLDPELGRVPPAGSGVADALKAIAIAVRAWVLRAWAGRGVADRQRAVGREAVVQHELPLPAGAVS